MYPDHETLLEDSRRTIEQRIAGAALERRLRDAGLTVGLRDRSAAALRWLADRVDRQAEAPAQVPRTI